MAAPKNKQEARLQELIVSARRRNIQVRTEKLLREAGYRIPDDVAVASLLVVVPEAPELAGCVAHHAAIGDAGVDALIAAIHEGEWGRPVQQRKLLLQPIWNEGSTLPRRG